MVKWENLKHAYGTAENIPSLLCQLVSFPAESSWEQEPWFSLWSALCHQGDIYSASFAAVPEIIKQLASAPQQATFSFFALPVSIEIARAKNNIPVPSELSSTYYEAIRELGSLAASWAMANPSSIVTQAAVAAFAASTGEHEYAELVLEIPKKEISEVLSWYWDR